MTGGPLRIANALVVLSLLCAQGCRTPARSEDAPGLSANEPKVEQGVEDALAAGGERDVLVLLAQPADASGLDAGLVDGVDVDPASLVLQLRALRYAAAAQQLLEAFPQGQLQLRVQYRHFPMLLLHLSSPQVLRALSARDDVAHVFEDRSHAAYLAQSLDLIHQPAVAAVGELGAGTSVAVLDTGCDVTQPAFGSCSLVGAGACKVAYAADFAREDGAADDTGHGSNVAGIVLGVAPATKILALDVFDGAAASSSDVLRAVDWVIENRAAYDIVAMSMSLGAGSFSAPCKEDALAVALAHARAAGVIPVAASGNDASSAAIAAPACAPAALSVGAVYDADIGAAQFAGCSDPSTGADQVSCFSNSAAFLSLLAPGAAITAGGSTQRGTSQAAAHVAGAIAVLRAALPQESPEAVVARITGSGPSLTDARNGVATRRLDLQAALDAPAADDAPDAGKPPPADRSPPVASLQIEDGGSYCRSPNVTLTLSPSGDGGVSSICLSNTDSCTNWRAYARTTPWTLSDGDGVKVVRAWLEDARGNLGMASATITLDSTPPQDGELRATSGDARVALGWDWFSDAGSGVGAYRVVFAADAPPVRCSDGTALYQGSANMFTHSELMNGSRYGYRVCAVDRAGNMSLGATALAEPAAAFEPPSGSVVIDDDVPITASSKVTLTLAVRGTNPIVEMCVSSEPSCSEWRPYAVSRSWNLVPGDGPRTVFAWFRDAAGNVSLQPASDSIVLDSSTPSDGSVTAVPGDARVELVWSGFADLGGGIASYSVLGATAAAPSSCDSGTLLYQGPATSFSHRDLVNGTTYGYRVCALDPLGHVSSGSSAVARPLPEFDAPVGSVEINAGAVATNSTSVSVALAASDASTPSHVCLSATTHCSSWQTFAATRSFVFSPVDGTRVLYVWFRDQWGNTSLEPVTDSIVMDRAWPRDGSVMAVASDGRVELAWSGFSDAGSGIAGYQLSFAPTTAPLSCATGTLLYSGTDTAFSHTDLSNGTSYAYRVCAIDRAGNVSGGKVVSARPAPEADPPIGSVSIDDGAAYTRLGNVTLALSASDASDVAQMCLSSTSSCSAWVAFATSTSYTLASGQGTRSVYVWFRDEWGNTMPAPVSDSIVLDSVAPTMRTFAATASAGSVALSWTAASDAISGVDSYTLVWARSSTAPASCATGTRAYTGGELSYVHEGLGAGTYSYRLCATDRSGNVAAGIARSVVVP